MKLPQFSACNLIIFFYEIFFATRDCLRNIYSELRENETRTTTVRNFYPVSQSETRTRTYMFVDSISRLAYFFLT